MYEKLDQVEKKFYKRDFPLNVAIEVSNGCNLNCIMCNHDKLTRAKGVMDMALYKKIIDEIARENPATRVWLDFYGEPLLLQYKLYYMIRYAKERGLQNVCMNTNATLMTPEIADMLLDSDIDFISFDVYGFSKEVLESISVGADRDAIYRHVEYFLQEKKRRGKTGMVAEVKVLELEQNREEVQQILQCWREKGAWTTLRRPITWGGSVDDDVVTHKITTDRIACGYSVSLCAITQDGYVATCAQDYDAETIYGNVKQDSIRTIWAYRNHALADHHLNHCWDKLPAVCQRCTDWSIIGEERWDENGNPVKKNYRDDEKMIEGY